MVVSPFTVAALATTAVANLDATALQTYTSGASGECESVLITGANGARYLARYPMTDAVQRSLIDELKPLSALSAGIRARLPFEVPREAGRAQGRDRTLFVYTFVPGQPLNVNRIRPLSPLGDSLAAGIAAIHGLPRGFVDDYGLPHPTIDRLRGAVRGTLERALESRRLPGLLAHRWDEALDADQLWDFEPTVIHGNLDEHALLIAEDRLASVLNWGRLRIGDPAQDLSWFVHSTREPVVTGMLNAYAQALEGDPDRNLRRRAMLYSEISLAEWLVFGLTQSDNAVIEDAAQMLAHLNDELEQDLMHPLVPGHTDSVPSPEPETAAPTESGAAPAAETVSGTEPAPRTASIPETAEDSKPDPEPEAEQTTAPERETPGPVAPETETPGHKASEDTGENAQPAGAAAVASPDPVPANAEEPRPSRSSESTDSQADRSSF
ncbi:MAG: phosphotransferase [Microbacteriaceae bacterium]|jgi:aminoglycoside phosphotransferase (APT) family kinase protein|nr:phosphotransferase [Microbacteriaceae bacterium]